jgi:DNA-directed RNA polymerase subunit RPC12/RpoP
MRPGSRYWKPAPGTRTLRDLAKAKLALIAVCQRCRHRSLLFPLDLAERLGANFPLDQIASRLRCTECQALGWVTLHDSMRD